MTRPRTPTSLLESRGAFKKNPQRKREDPEVIDKVGSPPAEFPTQFEVIWQELVSMSPKGVITQADRVTLEMACRLIAEMRKENSTFNAALYTRLHAILGSLGMTPADRSKVAGLKKNDKKENPFNQFR